MYHVWFMCILSKYLMCICCYQTWLKPSSDIQLMTSKATTSYRLIYQYLIVHLMSMQYSTYICLANYFDNSHSPEKLLKHLVMFLLPTDWYFLHHGHIDILGCYPYYPFFGGYTYRFFLLSCSYMYGTTWTSLLIWCGLACYFMILCPWLLFKTLSTNVSTSIKTLNTNTSLGPRARIKLVHCHHDVGNAQGTDLGVSNLGIHPCSILLLMEGILYQLV